MRDGKRPERKARMNKREWRIFYAVLRGVSYPGSSIATFDMDFSTAWCVAIPDESRRFYFWVNGFEVRLWYFALTLYGTPTARKLCDYYCPLTDMWRRHSYLLPCRKETP